MGGGRGEQHERHGSERSDPSTLFAGGRHRRSSCRQPVLRGARGRFRGRPGRSVWPGRLHALPASLSRREPGAGAPGKLAPRPVAGSLLCDGLEAREGSLHSPAHGGPDVRGRLLRDQPAAGPAPVRARVAADGAVAGRGLGNLLRLSEPVSLSIGGARTMVLSGLATPGRRPALFGAS